MDTDMSEVSREAFRLSDTKLRYRNVNKKKELQHSEFIARRQEGNLHPRIVIRLRGHGESIHYPFSEEIDTQCSDLSRYAGELP